MKLLMITAAVLATTLPAMAYTPNQNVTFEDFVTARGCVLNEVKGASGNVLYLTFAGGCPAAAEFTPVGSILVDADNNPATPDVWQSDN